jgi:hypothetical protein
MLDPAQTTGVASDCNVEWRIGKNNPSLLFVHQDAIAESLESVSA